MMAAVIVSNEYSVVISKLAKVSSLFMSTMVRFR